MKRKLLAGLIVVCMVMSLISVTAFASSDFSDTSGHWAEDDIQRWSDYGLISGYEDGTFRPDMSLTRGEFAALLTAALGLTDEADNTFSDLNDSAWYTPYMLKCIAAGVISGTDEGAEPESYVTREQAAVMLSKAFCIEEASGKTSYKDNSDISWWALGEVKAMSSMGLLAGMDNKKFEPKSALTRAQAVTILSAFADQYTNTEDSEIEADSKGTTMIAAGGVTVTGKAKDIFISQGASDSTIRLEDVKVTGTITVNAENCTVVLADGSSIKTKNQKVTGLYSKIINEEDIEETVYSLHDNYYVLKSNSTGRYVNVGGSGYNNTADSKNSAMKFYFKAADLGEYILYDSLSTYVNTDGYNVTRNDTLQNSIIWKVTTTGKNTFTFYNTVAEKYLAANGDSLILSNTDDDSTKFTLEKTSGSNPYPEADTDVSITDIYGNQIDPEDALTTPNVGDYITGYADTHAHLNHNLGSGEAVFADSNYSALGIQDALKDCSDVHGINGINDIWGLAVDGAVGHDTSGYPDFNYWPSCFSTDHQQAYYKWLERSWIAGQRVFVQQCVNNETLGQVMNLLPPWKNGETDDMQVVRNQVKAVYGMQDYIDAQCGGPGEGWFRICTNGTEAREAISKGQMAVFIGIEEDTIFGCEEDYVGEYNDGKITEEQMNEALDNIEAQMDEIYDLGVRSFFPVHALDNGFGGCQLYQGVIFEVMEYLQRQEFFTGESSPNPRVYYTEPGYTVEEGSNGISNVKGLTDTGEWLIHKMIEKKFVIEIDHMSDKTFNKVLDICWEEKYPGLIASHTRVLDAFEPDYECAWEQLDIPRMIKVMQLGGIISSMAIETTNAQQVCVAEYLQKMIDVSASAKKKGLSSATDFVYDEKYEYWGGPYEVPSTWYNVNSDTSDDMILGIPYATDVNGACMLPTLEESGDKYTDVNYDDGSFDALYNGIYNSNVANVRFYRSSTGNQTWDINTDNVAHYGLIPDLIQLMSSRPDMYNIDATFSSAEAYIRMFERLDKYSDTYPSRDPDYWPEVSTEYWHGAY